MSNGEVTFSVVVLMDELVVVCESLEAHRKLLDVLVDLVKAGNILDKLELVRTDGGDGSGEGSYGQ